MGYEGLRTIQKTNFEYIQEIDGKWYYLDEVLKYSKPYEQYKGARDGLLKYFEDYEDIHNAKRDEKTA